MTRELIDRLGVIKALDEAKIKTTSEEYDRIIDVIGSMPTINRWIPVTERLPEKNGRYLVTRGLNACGALWNRTYIANYSDLMGIKSERIWWQGNVGKSDFERLDDVTAWMPLPESYKAESEEGAEE